MECLDKIDEILKEPLNLSLINSYTVYLTVFVSEFEKFYNEFMYRILRNKYTNKLVKKINKIKYMLLRRVHESMAINGFF